MFPHNVFSLQIGHLKKI